MAPVTPANDAERAQNVRVKVLQRDKIKTRVESQKQELASVANLTAAQIEVKLSLLDRNFDQFDDLQTDLEYLDESQLEGNLRNEFEDNYFMVKSALIERLKLLQSLESGPSHNSTRLTSQSTSTTSRARLPKIELTPFTGNHTEWLDFYNTFSVLVDQNEELSAVEKFQYLRISLKESAASLVESLEITAANYERAKELLKSRYENKRFIFQAHLKKIFGIQRMQKPTVQALREFIDTVNANMRAMASIATQTQVADGILLHLVTSRLDPETMSKWEETISQKQEGVPNTTLQLPTWEELAKFLERRCVTINFIDSTGEPQAKLSESSKPLRAKPQQQQLSFVTTTSEKCIFCDTAPLHSPFKCEKLKPMTPPERHNEVKRLKLCFNCLKPNHFVQNCPSSTKCKTCNVNHHSLLHNDTPPETQQPTEQPQAALQVSNSQSEVLLATAVIEVQNFAGMSLKIRALLDGGSQVNFITEHVAQHLRLRRRKQNLEVQGIGSSSVSTHRACTFQIKSLLTSFSSTVQATILPQITTHQPPLFIDTSIWNIPENVPLADKDFNQPGPIDCLLGAGLFYELLMVGQIKLGQNLPVLQKTTLGWVASGPIQFSKPVKSNTTYKSFHATSVDAIQLEQMLERFWAIEGVQQNTRSFTLEEQECETFFEKTTSRCPATNKFIVKLPFKEDPTNLGSSYEIAKRRFVALEHSFKRNQPLFHAYSDFINEYYELGHMRRGKLHPNTANSNNYIPHHGVVKLDSSTTKLRVVFDASCRTSNGRSLNELLRVGPTLQDELFTILFRVRLHSYVLMGDIAKMYRQVWVHEDDIKWQSILWRNEQTKELETYELQTVTYGTSCAPYLAVKCLRTLAEKEASNFPIGAAATLRDFYVDNLLTGASSIEEVIEIKEQTTQLLNLGGFPLRKFASNCPEIIADIPPHDREETIQLESGSYIKTLGLKWSPTEDAFLFTYNAQPTTKITKRQILSRIASFFDPLGLLNPIIVSYKILMQELWKLKLNWDESVPQVIQTSWECSMADLALIHQIKINRYVPMNTTTNFHGFADASQKAYGACIYAVTIHKGKQHSFLLCAKSRVAPTKSVTLPRLELCAALLLAELLHKIVSIFQPANAYCWTDSMITLAWINGDNSRWGQFVSNRVTKIQDLTKQCTWQHVTTDKNPADLVSRGSKASDLINNAFWFEGPEFLRSDTTEWPHQSTINIKDMPEIRRCLVVSPNANDIIRSHKYVNNYNKLLRIMAYACRYAFYKKRAAPRSELISSEEYESALLLVCRIIQRSCFHEEINAIESGKEIPKTSKLKQLAPFIHKGLLRVGGRLKHSSLAYNVKHPVLLPNSHPFVDTLIRHFHHKNLHAGPQTLHCILLEQFWIINARNTVKRVIHQCVICYRCRPVLSMQLMGDLPPERVNQAFPFEITGVDYCGPILVTQNIRGRPPIKTYLAIFICFVVKAVHIELVSDLTTASFLMALQRFTARRGVCRVIYSDNATNFLGANRKLKSMLNHFNSEDHISSVQDYCSKEGIIWKFIPPRSPHFGGLWESAVKLAKHHLRRVIGTHILSHEELQTICCQAEAVVNSRPITPISSDPCDWPPLTPAQFLIGRNLTALPEPTVTEAHVGTIKRHQLLQLIRQQFWHRWRNEYIKGLQKRSKWQQVYPNLKENDIVLLQGENTPSLKWPIGRVVETVKGSDDRVRVVVVKTADGIHKRAISKICKLPIDSNNSISYRLRVRGEDVENN